jgi:hypothetical protein
MGYESTGFNVQSPTAKNTLPGSESAAVMRSVTPPAL